MKRKFAVAIMAFVLSAVCIIGLTACNPGDKPVKNAEFEEFEAVVKTVLDNSVNKMDKEIQSVRLTAAPKTVAVAAPMSLTADEKDSIFDTIDKYSSDAEIMEENYVKGMFDLVTQTTMAFPLIAGDALQTYPKVGEFFGVSVGCREEGIYIRVDKNGATYVVSVYTDGGNYSEGYYRMEIDYTSETDFSFVVLEEMSADAETEMDAYKMFYYGDSKMNFVNGMLNDDGGVFAYYRNGVDYLLTSAAAAQEIAPLLQDDFDAIDRTMNTDSDYIVTAEQWSECYLKYMNGGEHFGAEEGHFDIQNGVLYGWTGKDEDCPSIVSLPTTVSSIYYELRFPDHVTEITIPATVSSVKVERGRLEWLEGGKNEGDDKTLTDCPLKHFSIILNTQDGSYKFLDKINVSSASSLFESDGNFLYSKKDGMLLYVAGANKLTSLSFDSEMSSKAEICLQSSDLSKLKTLSVTEQTAGAAVYAIFDSESRGITLDTFNITLSGDGFGGTFGGAVRSIETVNITYNNVRQEREIDFECAIGTLNIIGSGACRVDTTSVIQKVNADFAGELSLHSLDQGAQIKNIELSDKVEAFSTFSTAPLTVELPYSLYFFKASGKYAGFSALSSAVGEMGWEDLLGKTELKSEVNSDGNIFYDTYRFTAMTQEEETECQIFADFKDIVFRTAEESEYGVPYAKLSCYWGDSSIIDVPETINGYPVFEFELATHPSWGGYPPVSVENVKEVHLPASLKKFNIMNWPSDEKQYALEKIVYGGTKEEFLRIIDDRDFYTLYAMLEYTNEIECSDGTFAQQPARESWLYADESGNILQIDLDWSDYDTMYSIKEIQVKLTYNGKEYFTHAFNGYAGSCSFQFGDGGETEAGEIKEYISIGFQAALSNSSSSRKEIRDLRVYHSFTLVSTEEFTGTIEHDFSEKVVKDPDCWSEGFTEWHCSICGVYRETTDRKPALGHDPDKYGACSRCGENQYFQFSRYENMGTEYAVLSKLTDTDLKTVYVPASYYGLPVKGIADSAFQYSSIESVFLPDTIETIGNWAFSSCASLQKIVLPKSLKTIGSSAFGYLPESASLYYEGSYDDWVDQYGKWFFEKMFFYSKENPYLNGTAEKDVNYWHYEADGVTPVIWIKEN